MLTPSEVTTLRSIKKTAVVILLLFRLDRPVTVTQLAGMLEIDRHTASEYLNQLRYQGIVSPTNFGWILTQSGSQLLLPGVEGIPPYTTTTTTTTIGRDRCKTAAVAEEWGENPAIVSESGENSSIDYNRCQAALDALADYGVSDTPTIIGLVQSKEYITAKFVEGSAERLVKEKRFTTSLLITVLRCGDPLPLSLEEKRIRSFKKWNLP